MRWLAWIAIGVHAALTLVGCGPSEQQKAEKRRIECLDKMCQGDVEPKVDKLRLQTFKVNGRWFTVPKEYGGYDGTLGFFWPSKTPANKEHAEKDAPEFIPSGPGRISNSYDVEIEIFLRSKSGPPVAESMYDLLLEAQTEGRVISKAELRPGLEMWRVRDVVQPEVWYVATALHDPAGRPPALMCRDHDPKFDRCTMGFMWQPGIAANLRFRAKHGPDWPEIYQEITRVLQLINKA